MEEIKFIITLAFFISMLLIVIFTFLLLLPIKKEIIKGLIYVGLTACTFVFLISLLIIFGFACLSGLNTLRSSGVLK